MGGTPLPAQITLVHHFGRDSSEVPYVSLVPGGILFARQIKHKAVAGRIVVGAGGVVYSNS